MWDEWPPFWVALTLWSPLPSLLGAPSPLFKGMALRAWPSLLLVCVDITAGKRRVSNSAVRWALSIPCCRCFELLAWEIMMGGAAALAYCMQSSNPQAGLVPCLLQAILIQTLAHTLTLL